MGDVLGTCEMSYNHVRPIVRMNEKPYQLLGDVREPLDGRFHVSVHEYRTAINWAYEIRYLFAVMYPDAKKSFWSWIILTHISQRLCLKHYLLRRPDGL